MATVLPSAKRHKANGPLIGTHSGTFHADEALAVYLLRLLPTYTSSPLVRTRDPEKLSTCHTVVDVGSTYDPPSNRYDHHQRGFSHTFPGHNTTLSSAGLVWLHFGKAVVAARAGWTESDPRVELVWRKLYKDFVEAVDANDNGINAFGAAELKDNAAPRFQERGFTLASVVADLNNTEIEDGDLPANEEEDRLLAEKIKPDAMEYLSPQEAEDARFLKASTFMGQTMLRKLLHAVRVWLPAKDAVDSAYNARHSVHPSGRVLSLKSGGVPWKEHLYAAEDAASSKAGSTDEAKVYYVLYPESEEPASKWRVQCVPVSRESFQSRKPLKEDWRGLRDDDLSAKSGIDGCVFCHASGFIGGNKTYEGALSMAQKSSL